MEPLQIGLLWLWLWLWCVHVFVVVVVVVVWLVWFGSVWFGLVALFCLFVGCCCVGCCTQTRCHVYDGFKKQKFTFICIYIFIRELPAGDFSLSPFVVQMQKTLL